jgi:hypothetical protein
MQSARQISPGGGSVVASQHRAGVEGEGPPPDGELREYLKATRPRELLGLALRKSEAAALIGPAEEQGWKLVDLVSLTPSSTALLRVLMPSSPSRSPAPPPLQLSAPSRLPRP